VSCLSLRSAEGAVTISFSVHQARGLPRRFAPRKDSVFVTIMRGNCVVFVIAKRHRRCGNLVFRTPSEGIAASLKLLTKTVYLSLHHARKFPRRSSTSSQRDMNKRFKW